MLHSRVETATGQAYICQCMCSIPVIRTSPLGTYVSQLWDIMTESQWHQSKEKVIRLESITLTPLQNRLQWLLRFQKTQLFSVRTLLFRTHAVKHAGTSAQTNYALGMTLQAWLLRVGVTRPSRTFMSESYDKEEQFTMKDLYRYNIV